LRNAGLRRRSINAVAFRRDDHCLLSASWDQLRLWNLDGEEIAAFTADAPISCCAFVPSERMIIAGDKSGRVHFLRLVEADETKPAIGDTKIQLLQPKKQVS
jgi:hypothetical protein